jgi:hypothetical protein
LGWHRRGPNESDPTGEGKNASQIHADSLTFLNQQEIVEELHKEAVKHLEAATKLYS